MPDYRRNRVPVGTFFFTVNLANRRSDLLVREVETLRTCIRLVRAATPFHIDAWMIPPDHMHCIWTLPEADPAYSRRGGTSNPVLESLARRRTETAGRGTPRWRRHLAKALLGTYDPR